MMELLVAVAVMVVLAAIGFSVSSRFKEEAELVRVTTKLQAVGQALVGYATDQGGLLLLEDAPGKGPNDWKAAREAQEEGADVWYNVLLHGMGCPSVADLAAKPEEFYDENYPLWLPGARYPIRRGSCSSSTATSNAAACSSSSIAVAVSSIHKPT